MEIINNWQLLFPLEDNERKNAFFTVKLNDGIVVMITQNNVLALFPIQSGRVGWNGNVNKR